MANNLAALTGTLLIALLSVAMAPDARALDEVGSFYKWKVSCGSKVATAAPICVVATDIESDSNQATVTYYLEDRHLEVTSSGTASQLQIADTQANTGICEGSRCMIEDPVLLDAMSDRSNVILTITLWFPGGSPAFYERDLNDFRAAAAFGRHWLDDQANP